MGKNKLQARMSEALRLTRGARVADATAQIQRTLRGLATPASSSTGTGAPGSGARVNPRPSPVAPAAMPPQPPIATAGMAGLPGQHRTDSYVNQYGARSYRLYVPSGYHGQPLPLLLMLHGCTQTADDFAVGTRMEALAEEHTFVVAFPAQSVQANQSGCWNWFKPADQRRDQGEPSLLAGITRQITATHAIDPRQVFVAGLSAGGAMAMIMAVTYPDLYAAVAVHSGLPYGAAHDVPSALTAMHKGGAAPVLPAATASDGPRGAGRVVPLIVFHGDRDRTVDCRNADRIVAQWLQAWQMGSGQRGTLPSATRSTTMPGGRAYSVTSYATPTGATLCEQWSIHGGDHAWSGGSREGSFTDQAGPDASRELLRFFLAHRMGSWDM